MNLQHGQGVVGDPTMRQPLRGRQVVDEIFDQLADVLAALGQRRHADRHNVQPVEQVLAEPPLGDLDLQVARGRGDDADIDLNVLFAPDTAEALLDQHAQDAALAFARHVADVVQIEGAVVGALEHADLARTTVAALLAEQFDVQPFRRHASGRDGDELGLGARAGVMDLACHQFLARARRPRDQDAAVGRRDLGDGAAQQLRRRRLPDQAGRRHGLGAQTPVLALQRGGFQGALDHHDQPVGLERFLDEVIGAALQGADGGFDVPVARDHDDRQVLIQSLDHIQQFQPVQTAALHPDVEHGQRRLARPDRGQGLVRVGGRADRMALVLKQARDQLADVRLVVHDQNVGTGIAHDASLTPPLAPRRRHGEQPCCLGSGGRSGTRVRPTRFRRRPASARRRGLHRYA
ncbi:hypothetical protein D3C86_578740 [compost metagenome]